MGKSKDDYKLKRSSPSSTRDEGRNKRHKSNEDDEKHKSKTKHKSHKQHSDKDKKSDRKRKDKSRKHDKASKLKIQELTKDDYSKNNEFAKWLKEEREIFFSDLSSDSARDLFSEFVEEWNNKELEPQYYEGIATGPRTSHKWNIKR